MLAFRDYLHLNRTSRSELPLGKDEIFVLGPVMLSLWFTGRKTGSQSGKGEFVNLFDEGGTFLVICVVW